MPTSIITRGEGVSIAGRQSRGLSPAFSRASAAYQSDGRKVGVGVPRFETVGGRRGVLVEEITTNFFPYPFTQEYYGGALRPKGAYYVLDGTRITAIAQPFGGPLPGCRIGIGANRSITVSGRTNLSSVSVFRKGFAADGGQVFAQASTAAAPDSSGLFQLTFSTGTDASLAYVHVGVGNPGVSDYWLDRVQAEDKSYSTSFVEGTRAMELLTLDLAAIGLDPHDSWTVEGLAKPIQGSNLASWRTVFQFGHYHTAGESELELWLNHSGMVKLWSHDNKSSRYRSLFAYSYAELGQGLFYAVAHDASVGTYRICIKTSSRTFWDTWQLMHSYPIAPIMGIGCQPDGGRPLNGAVSDLRLYRRALSDGEIAAHAAGNIVASDCFHYPFDGDLWPAPRSLGAVIAPAVATRPGQVDVVTRHGSVDIITRPGKLEVVKR